MHPKHVKCQLMGDYCIRLLGTHPSAPRKFTTNRLYGALVHVGHESRWNHLGLAWPPSCRANFKGMRLTSFWYRAIILVWYFSSTHLSKLRHFFPFNVCKVCRSKISIGRQEADVDLHFSGHKWYTSDTLLLLCTRGLWLGGTLLLSWYGGSLILFCFCFLFFSFFLFILLSIWHHGRGVGTSLDNLT